MTRPPLDLAVEITTADSVTYRWGSDARSAGSVPSGLSFGTKRGDGFADASVALPRRIDLDYVDLNLYDNMRVTGPGGDVAWDGRVGSLPRSMGDTHSVTVQAAGWMAHTRDRKFRDVIVDRDTGRWQPPGAGRRAAIITANGTIFDSTSGADATNGPAVITGPNGTWNFEAYSEAWYDAGPGVRIGALYYNFQVSDNTDPTDTGWEWRAYVSQDDLATTTDSTSNLRATSGSAYFTPTTPGRYALLQQLYITAPAGADGVNYDLYWRTPAVYGTHGLTRHGDDPGGFYASDIIKYLAGQWCPKLNTAGVQDTDYPIPHCVFLDPTDPYDAFLSVNAYHLWNLAVWEDRTLFYEPFDLTDYDWQVRLTDPGVTIDLQGDSTDQLANGMAVTFQDVTTGTQNRLEPADHAELRDDSDSNPANRAGLDSYQELALSVPTTTDAALQIGRGALAELNQPKGAGTISVRGHVRDRAGHWQPAWKVRAGDTVAVVDHPNPRPRLIVETSYSHDDKTLRISTDSTAQRIDALLDRLGTAIQINTVAP